MAKTIQFSIVWRFLSIFSSSVSKTIGKQELFDRNLWNILVLFYNTEYDISWAILHECGFCCQRLTTLECPSDSMDRFILWEGWFWFIFLYWHVHHHTVLDTGRVIGKLPAFTLSFPCSPTRVTSRSFNQCDKNQREIIFLYLAQNWNSV